MPCQRHFQKRLCVVDAIVMRNPKLFLQPCEFIAGVPHLGAMIDEGPCEIAFVGRSNVGKSSLLNALTNRKTLARVSHTPGRTQQLNFFSLGQPSALYLVDLPGYGYAKVSKQMRALWDELIFGYLQGRRTLRRVCVLVDARHGLKETDVQVLKWMDDAAVSTQVILTKADKVKGEELKACIAAVEAAVKSHGACLPNPIVTSSRDKAGLDELRAELSTFAS